MPHKHNPVAAAVILSAATRVPGLVSAMLSAMVQEDERGLGGWHAEWETLPEIVMLTAGAAHQLASVVPDLEIDVDRMRKNLELSKWLIFAEAITAALGEKIGRSLAREIIQEATQQANQTKRHLREILASDQRLTKHFSPAELDSLFDARNYFGTASRFIDHVLEHNKSIPKDKQA
jgi:3-carboxy-cis,cis-muconate cycloisomerase